MPTFGLADSFFRRFPSFADRDKRLEQCIKVVWILLHVVSVGGLFLCDTDLIWRAKDHAWCTVVYFLLLLATVFQYFLTSRSSPGNVLDAMKIATETHVNSTQSALGTGNMSTSWRNGSSLWSKLVTDLYPPGLPSRITTCADCHTIQPPRSKHCHDCHQCVLRFDHHCLWLGTCIGKGNHSRYWWYIFEETILCIWTAILYLAFLRSKAMKAWWKDFFGTVMFVVLIICLLPLLALLLFQRGAPAGIHPFRKGMCANLYSFCCSCNSKYALEAVPSREELEARARPYTCLDIACCRCC
uniref:S-acyltransferase n=1 Tax=Ananas comosus var. bracteatus TaxID=296719 RepID=A0A6V7NRQ4_ANACO|nr:unnamed protein product [Ananas comosus var. bracteatus]